MSELLTVRPMSLTDLPAVLAIQAICYKDILPESAQSLKAKISAAPAGCFVAVGSGQIKGYLFSLPWLLGNPPALNAPYCELPAEPNCLYLHDLAVCPSTHNVGVGRMLVEGFFNHARALQFERACLVAVQASASYWHRYGFHPVNSNPILRQNLASYGSGVEYMEFKL